ncbi:hydrogenase maturation protease [Balnearium lithotrophicum]|uniref:Hydrogenase maturation protease n=1 Tax=Balnearium lithotrophicum TaxID=223788 RepID=A0A521D3P6_9BACT|nr:hydrogenase maturation protease [Balnearium lithotrophicum]SMO66294.1 hydrogenase maturation protease [Balnearium lithotrophicum]
MNLLIGFGNPNFSDDGFGYYVVESLREEFPSLHFLAPTSDLINKILKKEKVVFVDAVKLGKKPGEIIFFKLSSENLKVNNSKSHTLSLNSVLKLGYELFRDEMSMEIYFIGVEAENINTFKKGLSERVKRSLPEVKGIIRRIFSS